MGSDSPLSPFFASTQFYKRGKLNGGGGGEVQFWGCAHLQHEDASRGAREEDLASKYPQTSVLTPVLEQGHRGKTHR